MDPLSVDRRLNVKLSVLREPADIFSISNVMETEQNVALKCKKENCNENYMIKSTIEPLFSCDSKSNSSGISHYDNLRRQAVVECTRLPKFFKQDDFVASTMKSEDDKLLRKAVVLCARLPTFSKYDNSVALTMKSEVVSLSNTLKNDSSQQTLKNQSVIRDHSRENCDVSATTYLGEVEIKQAEENCLDKTLSSSNNTKTSDLLLERYVEILSKCSFGYLISQIIMNVRALFSYFS